MDPRGVLEIWIPSYILHASSVDKPERSIIYRPCHQENVDVVRLLLKSLFFRGTNYGDTRSLLRGNVISRLLQRPRNEVVGTAYSEALSKNKIDRRGGMKSIPNQLWMVLSIIVTVREIRRRRGFRIGYERANFQF